MLGRAKTKIKHLLLGTASKNRHLRPQLRVNKRWYGNQYGGFYLNPSLINENSIIYSVGIGEDISFDKAIIEYHGSKVFGFDPTPKSKQYIEKNANLVPENFIFSEFGLAASSGTVDFYLPRNKDHVSGSSINQENVDQERKIEVQMRTMKDLMDQHAHEFVDVLKMDIEGSEYEVINSLEGVHENIGQILIEFHDRFFEAGVEMSIEALKKLRGMSFEVFAVSESFEEVSLINTKLFPDAN